MIGLGLAVEALGVARRKCNNSRSNAGYCVMQQHSVGVVHEHKFSSNRL